MKHTYAALAGGVLLGTLMIAGSAYTQEPDNSKTNQRDRDSSAQQSTPQNATATRADLDTLQNIRKAITDDKNLSTYAHNVRITVKDGAVTLRGPVRAESEKARIEALAKANGASSVTNELELAPTSK